MANIKIVVDGPLMDGHKVTFKAPCPCSEVEKLNVYYVKEGTQVSRSFTMKDTHGNDLTGIGDLFIEGAYVHVILDTIHAFAYLQNADTNGYLESLNNALYDTEYNTPKIVGKRGNKKVYRIRKRFTVTAEFYERTPVAHGLTCSDIWFDRDQSYCNVTGAEMYSETDKIQINGQSIVTTVDTTNIYVWQALSDKEIVFDVVLFYVEV